MTNLVIALQVSGSCQDDLSLGLWSDDGASCYQITAAPARGCVLLASQSFSPLAAALSLPELTVLAQLQLLWHSA